jgi:prepilin-type processing-associated H-X9-DG protein
MNAVPIDGGNGDSSYAGNIWVFGDVKANINDVPTGNTYASYFENIWDGKASLPMSFPDGTSNTILFAEKYARCNGGGPGGAWWMRGVLPGAPDDFLTAPLPFEHYPGDPSFSAVFGMYTYAPNPGSPDAMNGWNMKFQVQPANPLSPDTVNNADAGGRCTSWFASTPHSAMNVAMADGSVRVLSGNISALTWKALVTPADGDAPGDDW